MHWLIRFVGNYFVLISVVYVAICWLFAGLKKKISLGYQLVVGGLITLLLGYLAGRTYFDPRPFVTHHLVPIIAHAADNGFPSDHVLLCAFLGFTMLLYSKRAGIFLLMIAFLVGWVRVAAHIHNPRDVVGSFVIAAVSVAIARLIAVLWSFLRKGTLV